MLTIIAAAALVLPDAGKDFARETHRDIPREVLKTNVAGIWYQAFVDASGKITDCAVRGTLGETKAAELACEAVKGKRIMPARVDGRPAYGVYRGVMVLSDNTFQPEDIVFEPDVVLEVENLRGSRGRPLRTELAVLVDEQGRIASCVYRAGRNSSFTRAACDQAREIRLPVGRSESGEAVAYVYPLTFEFTGNLASR